MAANRIEKTGLLALLLVAVMGTASCSKQEPPSPVMVLEPVALPSPDKPKETQIETPAWIKDTFGDRLVDKDGKELSTDTLAGKKIGMYFSAHWCPPCKTFSPELVKVYNAIKEKGHKFEIVLVSSDNTPSDMSNYMLEVNMPWLAIPFESVTRSTLAERYDVQGIPMLIIVNEAGYTITKNGRNDVTSKGADAFKTW